MKVIKLTALSVAVLASSAAMANQQPAYQYDSNAGIVSNTTGAIAGTTKTLFNTVTHPGAISAEIGTMGYGANIAWGLNESTELQAGWSGMKYDDDVELNSNDSWINYEKVLGDGYDDFKGNFDFEADLSNPYLGVQMRPMNNWLTVGAGVMVPRNELDARLTPTDGGSSKVTIDNREYNIPEGTTVDMHLENKNKLAPYATIGFRPNINNQWGGFIEAGAAYMGNVKSDVRVNGTVTSPDPAIVDAVQSFERDAENELNDNDDIWYPILKAGLTYRF